MKRTILWFCGVFALAGLSCSAPAPEHAAWIGTWATSPTGFPATGKIGSVVLPPLETTKGTIRYRLRVSQGGSQVRLRFSNEFSATPLEIEAVSVGLAGEQLDALPGSQQRATFAGRPAVVLSVGASVLTDPVNLPVNPLADLVVSVYAPGGVMGFKLTKLSKVDPGAVEGADATLLEKWPATRNVYARPLVSAVEVRADQPRRVVVALGDSITDGSVDPATGERGWPGALARRIVERGFAVVNAGINSNRLLQSASNFGPSALDRLDRDVFSVPGLSHIIVLEGINDIGMNGPGGFFADAPLVQPAELITAYRRIIARAHGRKVKILGATLLPFAGAPYYTAEKEQVRAEVNAWIRTSGAFDGVIDFDASLRDPAHPEILKAEFDSGDHLHPNRAGSRRMGEMIDLHLFDS